MSAKEQKNSGVPLGIWSSTYEVTHAIFAIYITMKFYRFKLTTWHEWLFNYLNENASQFCAVLYQRPNVLRQRSENGKTDFSDFRCFTSDRHSWWRDQLWFDKVTSGGEEWSEQNIMRCWKHTASSVLQRFLICSFSRCSTKRRSSNTFYWRPMHL
jgi:hypothetical protein